MTPNVFKYTLRLPRLSLDKATGSINISDLRSEDSGKYDAQIINGDHRVRSFSYNLCSITRSSSLDSGTMFRDISLCLLSADCLR